MPLIRKANLLLVTILIWANASNSLVAILIDQVYPGIAGFFIVVVTILLFGEIIPQALSQKFGLLFGASTLPITYVFFALTFIISYPISKILDIVLGKEEEIVLSKSQMKKLF
mgnify:FL=1